jgi:hypothetical protein
MPIVSRPWFRVVFRRRARRQAGLTLVALMVALAVSGTLIALILGVHVRKSSADRVQGQVAELGKALRAVRGRLISDVRQAGFMIPDGFKTAAFGAPDEVVPPLVVENETTAPDRFTVYFADPSATARVLTFDGARRIVEVSDLSSFAVGDLVVVTNPRLERGGSGTSGVARYDACAARITALDAVADPPRLILDPDGGFNVVGNPQCDDVAAATRGEGTASESAAFRLAARAYRIDPEREALGVLQVELTGGLLGEAWHDLAIGVVNLQVATRFDEDDDAVDRDADGDPERDWYAGEAQERVDATGARGAGAVPLELTLSLEVRSAEELPDDASTRTTSLTDDSEPPESILHNAVGDWEALDLAALDDADRPPAYRGEHIFRASSTTIDLRNVGSGR